MGCKLSISVVHPENIKNLLSPKKKLTKANVDELPSVHTEDSPDSECSYKTVYID